MLREGRVWAPKEVMVPISEVGRLAEKAVYLQMSRAIVEALPSIPVRRGQVGRAPAVSRYCTG
jgi:hypothetical protein